MILRALTISCLLLLLGFSTQAQKVNERDVLGTWKLVIEIEEELEEEAEEAETILEEAIINAVSGLVTGLLDNIEIYFEFQKKNRLLINVNAYGESEEEEASWYINNKGYLVIEDIDDDDNFQFSADDDEWKLVDGILVNDDEDDANVYMTKVD